MIAAPELARRLGITTATLANWRSQGRGPRGAVHVSSNLVVYPEDAVAEFLQELELKGAERVLRARAAMQKAREAKAAKAAAREEAPNG